jgi:uncharacterized protein YceK
MKIIVLVLVAAALAGCSALGINTGGAKKSESRAAPTVVNCNGFLGWEACNAKAAQMCPKGYDVAKREESQPTQTRTMYFTCN